MPDETLPSVEVNGRHHAHVVAGDIEHPVVADLVDRVERAFQVGECSESAALDDSITAVKRIPVLRVAVPAVVVPLAEYETVDHYPDVE